MADTHLNIPPYTPNWLYRMHRVIDRLPSGTLALAFTIFSAVLHHLVAWEKGLIPRGEIKMYFVMVGPFIVLFPLLWTFLAQRATRSLHDFYSLQQTSQKHVQRTIAEFISIPTLSGTLAFIAGGVFGGVSFFVLALPLLPLAGQTLPAFSILSWSLSNAFVAVLVYRSLHQAKMVSKLYAKLEIDIYNTRPIYALSNFGGLTSLVGVGLVYGLTFIGFTDFFYSPMGWIYQGLMTAVSLGLFFAPLVRVNRRLRRAKDQVLAALGSDLRHVQQELHAALRKKKLSGMADLRNAAEALKSQIEYVQKIPTWPWQPETLRGVVSPLLLPVIVYLFQRYLSGFLGLQ
jgi:hypothetical protein